MRDKTLMTISRAINIEHIGSAIIQPNKCIKTADTITPTDPKVSANICKKTPRIICEFVPVSSSP